MAKVDLNTIMSGFASTDALNTNFDNIEDAFDNTLSRNGSTPNSMSAEIDMNSNKIINLAAPSSVNDAARLEDLALTTFTDTTLPAQAGHAGDVLGTNGTIQSWITPDTSPISVADKAAAQAIEPASGASLVIMSADGNGRLWYAITGGSGLTDNGGTSCGTQFIPSGGDGTTAWRAENHTTGIVYAIEFGATGDGVTDDSTAIYSAQTHLASYGGGTLLMGDGSFLIDSSMDIRQNVNIVGNKEYIDFTDRDYWPEVNCSIIVNSTATLQMLNGSGIRGVVIYRKGMTFPSAGLTAVEVALYAGIAITVKSAAPSIMYCTILGFERAIVTDTTNTPRGRVEYVNIDCTNGIRVDLDYGSWTIENVYCHPILSNTDADNIRTGIGFDLMNRSDWTTLIGCFAFNDIGFRIIDCNQVKFINCMADHPTDGTDIYHTGTGFDVSGNSVDNYFIGCQTASHERGFDFDTTDGDANYMTDCHIWNMKSIGFGVVVDGGDLHITSGRVGEFHTSAGKGVFVNDVNSNVYIKGTHFNGLDTAIDTPSYNQFVADNSCVFESITTAVRSNEALAQVASATTLTLPNNINYIEVTGTTTITTVTGANRLPHELVTLYFSSALTVDHGNLILNGSVNQAFTAGSTLTLRYETGNVWREAGRMVA